MSKIIHLAAKKGDKRAIKNLIEEGVDVNSVSAKGKKTALMYAAENGHYHLFSLLIDAGAEVNAKDEYGQTALLNGIKKGYPNYACNLLRYGADPNISDKFGNALAYAVAYNQSTPVMSLLKAGGNIYTKYPDGTYIYERAVRNYNAKIIALLWLYGAELDLSGVRVLCAKNNYETIILLNAIGATANQQERYWAEIASINQQEQRRAATAKFAMFESKMLGPKTETRANPFNFSGDVVTLSELIPNAPTADEISAAVRRANYRPEPCNNECNEVCGAVFKWALRNKVHGKEQILEEIVESLRPDAANLSPFGIEYTNNCIVPTAASMMAIANIRTPEDTSAISENIKQYDLDYVNDGNRQKRNVTYLLGRWFHGTSRY